MSLDEIERDALRELGNIGLGNAVMALSEMTGQTFYVAVPKAKPLNLFEIQYLFGDPERTVVGASMPVSGDLCGDALFLFSWESASSLWQTLTHQTPKDAFNLSELQISMIGEIGNIMVASYLNAISTMTGLNMSLKPPSFVADMASAALGSFSAEAMMNNREAISIQTDFESSEGHFEGFFLFLPSAGGVKSLLSCLEAA